MEKATDPCECGVLTINWKNKTWGIDGIGGHTNDRMTPKQVHDKLAAGPPSADEELWAVVQWAENADGLPQLSFYDLNDFRTEVYEDGPVYDEAKFIRYMRCDAAVALIWGRTKLRTPESKRPAALRAMFNTYVVGNSLAEREYAEA